MRYLVTGGSGYIGSRLVEQLGSREETDRILIADVRPPRSFRPKTEWAELDVRDAAATRDLVARERPDVLIHLAFVLNPIKDEQLMYDIDVNGTHNVLEAASQAGVEHVLVTSSTTAYGAFPDNPVPITEEWPVRGVAAFEYARDKTESDRLCQLWALAPPGAHDDDRPAVHRVRPERRQLPRAHLDARRRSSPTSAATSTS